jgi:hypothetical protein
VTVHQLFIDFKKAYDSVRREVLYNILIEFGVPMKIVRLIKMLIIGFCILLRVILTVNNIFKEVGCILLCYNNR